MSNELLFRLKLDLKNQGNNNIINHNFEQLPNTKTKHTDLDTKGNNSATQSIYESEIIELKNDDQLVVDGSGADGRLGKIGADGRHLLVLIKLVEDTLRVSVFMSSPTNGNDTVEEVYELENFFARKPHILITTEGGTGGNGCPTTSQLFGDSFDNTDDSIMGKDGGDGGNVTIVIEENIKYLLDEQYLNICCQGGNGGQPYVESYSFGDFDVNSIVLPPEAPLSTVTSQSSVLTFSKLSFVETPSQTSFNGYQTKTKNNSIWKGVNGRKGRNGIIKYIVVSKQTGDVIEQANTTFNLRVTSFNVKIVANAVKEKTLGTNLILEDDNLDSSDLDLVDPTHFIEPGCELAITDIEIKNLGGLSAPLGCFIEFEGNDFADVLGFYTSLKLDKTSESNNQLTLPNLNGGESTKLPLPLRLLVGKQVKHTEQITAQSCNLSYFIRKQEGLILSQGQLCDLPIFYPLSLSSFECPNTIGLANNSQKVTISIENKSDHSLIGSSIKLYITNKDIDTERIFTDNIFSIQETGTKFDRYNSQIDPELSVIESVTSIPQDRNVIEKDLLFSLEKKLNERVTTFNFLIQILNHKKIDEETLGFRKFHLILELEYKGNIIERKVHTMVVIPDRGISSYQNTTLGKALLVTDSNYLTSKAYLYYKRLLRSIGFGLFVWDSRYHGEYKNNKDIFPYFKDSLILVTLFTTSSDILKYERIISHFNNSNATPNESGLLYVTGYPYSMDSNEYRNQLFEYNAQKYTKYLYNIDSKYLSIFYPIEKPSKTLFLEKVNNYIEKKRDQSPYLLMKVQKKEFFENLKYRMPRRIKIGDASINILPIKSNDRLFCVKFTTSKIASNNIPEFSPDILTDYHKFSFNSKTFALIFSIVMSSSMQQKVNLLLNRYTEKEWQFCDNKSMKSENSNSIITIRDISLFSIYFEIIQEVFLKENLLHRFKLLVKCISDCFINTPSIAEADKEQLLQYVKILLDKLRYESTKIPTQDKAISLKKKEFQRYYAQLRKILVEKCRLLININKKKSTSSKRMYKMLGGETLQVKKKQFDDNCRYLLQFILKPSSEWYDDSSMFRFQKNKWSFERLLIDSEEGESQTLPLLF